MLPQRFSVSEYYQCSFKNWSIEIKPGLALAGLLVGVGSRMGNGCTSGHGVCGLSRLSLRSLINVLTFIGSGFVTVFLMRHVF